jgi:hypothetical protein
MVTLFEPAKSGGWKMSEARYVTEANFLITVAKWLHASGWQLEKVPTRDRNRVKHELTTAGISINNIEFRREEEDIRARQRDNLWRIECKDLSSGKRKTVKSNFDKAVASTVSYYAQKDGLRLDLALSDGYNTFLQNKLPQALKEVINLWIFLHLARDEVLVYAPEEELLL